MNQNENAFALVLIVKDGKSKKRNAMYEMIDSRIMSEWC